MPEPIRRLLQRGAACARGPAPCAHVATTRRGTGGLEGTAPAAEAQLDRLLARPPPAVGEAAVPGKAGVAFQGHRRGELVGGSAQAVEDLLVIEPLGGPALWPVERRLLEPLAHQTLDRYSRQPELSRYLPRLAHRPTSGEDLVRLRPGGALAFGRALGRGAARQADPIEDLTYALARDPEGPADLVERVPVAVKAAMSSARSSASTLRKPPSRAALPMGAVITPRASRASI